MHPSTKRLDLALAGSSSKGLSINTHCTYFKGIKLVEYHKVKYDVYLDPNMIDESLINAF